MQKDLVSIIIPCYNGEQYIDRCFNALINQTYKNLEVIAVNDGSTDNTSQILNKYVDIFKENKIIFKIINQENMGQAAAVNKALKQVNGEFLVWQDCDDYYENDAIESLKNYLEQNINTDFVRGESVSRDSENLNIVLSKGKSKYPNSTKIFDFYVFETDAYMYPGIFMVRMDFFDKCIKNREIYTSRAGQNWQLILPLAYYGNCGYLNKVVYNYIIINKSHSHSVKSMKDLLKRCDEHKDILFHVLDSLDMSKSYLNVYKRKIKFKYLKRKVKIVISKTTKSLLRESDYKKIKKILKNNKKRPK